MADPTPAAPPAQTPPAPTATPAPVSPPAAETPQTPAGTPAGTPPPAGQPAAPATPSGPARGPDGKFLAKPAEPAPGTPPPAEASAPLIPADWKPKAPDGVTLDEALLGSFRGIMADPKLSHADRAQALVDLQIKYRADELRVLNENTQRQRHADLEKLKGDPEFGGARFDQTMAGSKSILSALKYGPAVSKKLEAYGLDCDPDFTKLFAEVRSLIAEDSTSSRLTSPTPANGTQPMSQIDRQAATYKASREKRSRQ